MNTGIMFDGRSFVLSRLPTRNRVRMKSHLKLQGRLSRWCKPYSSISSLPTQNVIFSGIQPTGVPHLGNYLGALREWVQLQNSATEGTKLLFSIVDLHALTVPQDANQLRQWRKEMLVTLLAVGLDPSNSTIFYQSAVGVVGLQSLVYLRTNYNQVLSHTELFWALSTVASMGYLSRMTQWKVSSYNNDICRNGMVLGLTSFRVSCNYQKTRI